MAEGLNITLVQSDIIWEDTSANLEMYSSILKDMSESTDIVVLPEMCNTGFTMTPERVAETMDGSTISWMKAMAEQYSTLICGSVVIKEDQYYNRFVAVEPSGDLHYYDKRHTFTLAGEHLAYQAGTARTIFKYKGWRICPMICYDLRFPVWSRNTDNYDVLIYVANWPEPRIQAWDALLKARAIENMAYCIGVNRVGFDPNGHHYVGHSNAYDPLGNALLTLPEVEARASIRLDKNEMQSLREKLNFLDDRDHFNLII